MSAPSVSPCLTFADFSTVFGDRLITPAHVDYDSARTVWNGRVDRRPEFICQASTASEVQLAVSFACQSNLPLAVRGHGHCVTGNGVCDGGLVIDLSGMKNTELDEEQQTAKVQPGLTVGEFYDWIAEHGYITTVGSHSTVGLAGFTLGGGVGLLMSRYGLSSDNLIAAEIVTADGQLLTISESENSDLFWAIRGGGGNFGVVTSLTYRLHKVEPMTLGVLVHPLPRFRQVLNVFREQAEAAPGNLGIFTAVVTGPTGHAAASLMVCHTGDPEEGARLIAPIRAFGPPVADMVGPAPYGRMMHALDGLDPNGQHHRFHSRGIVNLTDELLDIIADFSVRRTSPQTTIIIYRQHGAVTELPEDATAYPARHLPYLLGIFAGWPDGDGAEHIAWLASFGRAVDPLTVSPGFSSLLDCQSDQEICNNYGKNYGRLQEIKAKWDPTNLFNHNHNIVPASQRE